MEIRTLQQESIAVGSPKADGEFEVSNQDLLDAKIDASSIMIQVLKRPSDAIAPGLQEVLYEWIASGMAYQTVTDSFGGWIDVARNYQTRLFRKSGKFKWLLLIDCDVTPPKMAPVLLARHNLPVVSACVCGYNAGRGVFVCVAARGPDGRARFPTVKSGRKLPARGIAKVTNTGTGCLMIRADVVEALWSRYETDKAEHDAARQVLLSLLEKHGKIDLNEDQLKHMWQMAKRFDLHQDLFGPPFGIPQSVRDRAAETGGLSKGEDICFTDRVRAAGFDIYVDFEVQCGHDKTMRLHWPTDLIDAELDAKDWCVTAFDAPVEQEGP
jgi:hypothetical protein